ncbi:uncharacterized protein [Arachis hypogaea]|uniref:uncharacterized protein n=1 Tax=Arachis hypogaea TaxID=3818 RepID=UPI000DED2D43|nr:uncharacterized protein LOC112707166 [Arachis hypogaea]QHO31396.1 uncharacterized protein DS421_8g241220 [Arachis hypogaea]
MLEAWWSLELRFWWVSLSLRGYVVTWGLPWTKYSNRPRNQMLTRRRRRRRGRGRLGNATPEATGNIPNPVDFMAALGNMAAAMQVTAEALGNQINNGNNGNNGDDGPMTLSSFLKVQPPTFRGTSDPTDADNWIQAIEQALQAQQVNIEQ